MVPLETNDEKIVLNEDSKPVSAHTLHNQLVILVSWLDTADRYMQFLPIILYHEWRVPKNRSVKKDVRKFVDRPFDHSIKSIMRTNVGISDLVLVGKPI